jgi:hypothetical protein
VISSHHLNWTVLIPSRLKQLQLPCSDETFQAANAVEWLGSMKKTQRSHSNSDLGSALYSLLRHGPCETPLHENLSPSGRQLLLYAVMESYDQAVTLPSSFSSLHSYQKRDLRYFSPQHMFKHGLRAWRNLWWTSIECMWNSEPPNLVMIQSILVLNYLEVTLLDPGLDNETQSEYTAPYTAINVALDVFSSISKNGFIEVCGIVFLFKACNEVPNSNRLLSKPRGCLTISVGVVQYLWQISPSDGWMASKQMSGRTQCAMRIWNVICGSSRQSDDLKSRTMRKAGSTQIKLRMFKESA